jgi:hypothetical protein
MRHAASFELVNRAGVTVGHFCDRATSASGSGWPNARPGCPRREA